MAFDAHVSLANLIKSECGCLTNRKVILFTIVWINDVIHQVIKCSKKVIKIHLPVRLTTGDQLVTEVNIVRLTMSAPK